MLATGLVRCVTLITVDSNFPTLPRRPDELNSQAHFLNGQNQRHNSKSNLAPFAKMVLDSTSISYRCKFIQALFGELA